MAVKLRLASCCHLGCSTSSPGDGSSPTTQAQALEGFQLGLHQKKKKKEVTSSHPKPRGITLPWGCPAITAGEGGLLLRWPSWLPGVVSPCTWQGSSGGVPGGAHWPVPGWHTLSSQRLVPSPGTRHPLPLFFEC